MDSRLYQKSITCPVCSKPFEITKVKSNGSKIESVDSDFCVYYEGINPILYDVWICEHCGYAAQADKFESITFKDSKLILENITPRWTKRSFAGERTVENAIETFKLALYTLHVRNAKNSELAKVCIRIAWLYRILQSPKEREFLEFALRSYTNAFETERFPVDKLDEFTCMFMIGELNRRVGNTEEAVKWFSRIISSPDARSNRKLLEKTREQYEVVKGQLGNETAN